MTIWLAIGLFITVSILLLARSAWVQGEFRQFAKSLLLTAMMLAALAAIVGLYALLSEGL